MSTCKFKLILDARDMTEAWPSKLSEFGSFETVMEDDGIHVYCAFLCNDVAPMTVISETYWKVQEAGYKIKGIIWRAGDE